MVGTIRYQRWFYQAELSFFVKGIAHLDQRLGLVANRVSPGLAHKLGCLASDLPQSAAIHQLREQFRVRLSVDTYRSTLEHLSCEACSTQDDVAIEQLVEWLDQAEKSEGKHQVLMLVGRDGVHIPMRSCWREAACATIAVYDRNRKRLGTIYLGEMPQANQVTMTKRLTKVIQGTLQGVGSKDIKLRYVTDAGTTDRARSSYGTCWVWLR